MAADDEGAIDTNEEAQQYQYPEYGAGPSPSTDDNSGAAPPVAGPADDNSGAAPVASAPGGDQAIDTSLGTDSTGQPATGPKGPIARGIKGIVSYLMGAGAEHPAVLDQAAAAVDPEGARSQGDRNIMAVEAASQKGGPEAAWKLVQANRVAYNAKQAFAYAALNGNQQKPADLNAAIQAANQAADHVLDGSSVQFVPGQNGVTATVTQPGATQPQSYNLTTDQFREYLNVGRTGQWDRMMQDGIGGTIQKIASGATHQRGAPPAPRPAQAPAPQRAAQQAPQEEPQATQVPQTNFGSTPSTENLSGNTDKTPDSATQDRTGYSAELQARAAKMFPGITQEGEAQRWMSGQTDAEAARKNSIDTAAAKNDTNREIAQVRANAQRDVQTSKGDTAVKVQDKKTEGWKYASDGKTKLAQITQDGKLAASGDKAAHDRMETARKTISALRATGNALTPEQVETEKMLSQVPQGRPQQAPQQQAKQQAPQQQAPVKDPAAMKWLQDYPNDPRAPAVRKKLGL